MNHPRRPSRRPAFTLIELILSLTMVAMLAGALYMCLSIATRARDNAATTLAPLRGAMLGAELLRQDFESVLAPNGTFALNFIGQAMDGGDSLDFFCLGNDAGWNLSEVPPTGQALQDAPQPWTDGPRHVVLLLRTDVSPPMLVRQVTRNLLTTNAVVPDEEVICRNVKSFMLQYFDGQTWQDSWDSTALGNVLPNSVRLTLEVLLEPEKPGVAPRVYKMVRTFNLACAPAPAGGAQ